MPVRLGDDVPPGLPTEWVQVGTPIQAIQVQAGGARTVQPFWRPLLGLGLEWDIGWLGTYLLAYLPVFVVLRRALRLP